MPTNAINALQVVAQEVVEVPGFRLLTMSPDGRWLLGLDDEQGRLCGIEIATMAPQGCAAVVSEASPGPAVDSIAWSPDGARVAMTEDGQVFGYERDLWVFEMVTGRLTNLTDDGVTGNLLQPAQADQPWIDLYPAWSPDGQHLAVAQTVLGENGWTEGGVFRIAVMGGEPEQIAPGSGRGRSPSSRSYGGRLTGVSSPTPC